MSELPKRSGDLAGQVAVITGAVHGQGQATALALAREGAHIVAIDVARPLAYPGYRAGDSATSIRCERCAVHLASSVCRLRPMCAMTPR